MISPPDRDASMPLVFVAAARLNMPRLAQILCSCRKLLLDPRFFAHEAVSANAPACFALRNRSSSRLALACTRHARRSNPHS